MTTYNKVTLDGTTLMDLSQDTVADASHIRSGYVGHLNDGTQVTGTYTGGGSTKNIQAYIGMEELAKSSYTATDLTLTVAKTGTYTVSWDASRNTTSGTTGTQLYIGNTAYGSANTSFTRNYFQHNELTGVSLTKDQIITVYARSRNTSYYVMVGNLVIKEE